MLDALSDRLTCSTKPVQRCVQLDDVGSKQNIVPDLQEKEKHAAA